MPHRILVADDDPHIREVICFALSKAGMKTESVGDGATALRQATASKPDLVVLDVGMPEMDGLDVCRELRKTSSVPILFSPPVMRRSTVCSDSKWAATTM
jgi:two-component system OmpR family response regulator